MESTTFSSFYSNSHESTTQRNPQPALRCSMAFLLSFSAPSPTPRRPVSAVTGKHSDRLLSSLATAPNSSATDRLIRRFVASSSKSTALNALSLLLTQSSPFALPMYQRISASHWFNWNPKLAAATISLLESQNRFSEAETLISDSVSRLNSPRDLALFYCDLIDAASERGLKRLALESYARIQEVPFSGRKPFESMIKGLSLMGSPSDGEKLIEEMAVLGYRPSPPEYRSVVQGYGKMGLFTEMRRVLQIMDNSGMGIDTVCANMVLSCYGHHGEVTEMLYWIRRMRELGIGFSVRTFNSALNCCPTLVSMVRDLGVVPLSIEDLIRKLDMDLGSPNEAMLVQELVSSPVLVEMLGWSNLEGKFDLHGFHLASAYVILLQWINELRIRIRTEVVPMEISVVCGSGKHSIVRGESPVRKMVAKMMIRLNSPLRIDRKNVGRFVAKGGTVKEWLR